MAFGSQLSPTEVSKSPPEAESRDRRQGRGLAEYLLFLGTAGLG